MLLRLSDQFIRKSVILRLHKAGLCSDITPYSSIQPLSPSPPPQRMLKPKSPVLRPDPRDDPFINSSSNESFQSLLTDLYENDKILVKMDVDKGTPVITPRRPNYALMNKPFEKPFESSYGTVRPVNGIKRALDQLRFKPKTRFVKPGFNAFYDIVIIGGGVMGCLTAYHFMDFVPKGLKIAVIEKDLDYSASPVILSVGGIRQQFSTPENVLLSQYGADFYRHLDKFLFVNGEHLPTVHFQPQSYLYLASEEGATKMEEDHRMQISFGAKTELLTPQKIKKLYPWINTDGIAVGSLGMENEGFIDTKALLESLRTKCVELGVDFVHGQVHNMVSQLSPTEKYKDTPDTWEDEKTRMTNRVCEVHVELTDGDVFPIFSSQFVIAGGSESGHLAYLAGIGAGSGMLSVPLPVVRRKRYIYNCRVKGVRGSPGLDSPMIVDPSGVFFRRVGYAGDFLAGRSPPHKSLEPKDPYNLDVDMDYFDEHVWPHLSNRIPHLSHNTTITDAWSTIYDHNLHDQNAIIGSHPHHSNILFATGFTGQGLSLAPGVARALSEYIIESDYKSIDLTRLDFRRILHEKELFEAYNV